MNKYVLFEDIFIKRANTNQTRFWDNISFFEKTKRSRNVTLVSRPGHDYAAVAKRSIGADASQSLPGVVGCRCHPHLLRRRALELNRKQRCWSGQSSPSPSARKTWTKLKTKFDFFKIYVCGFCLKISCNRYSATTLRRRSAFWTPNDFLKS